MDTVERQIQYIIETFGIEGGYTGNLSHKPGLSAAVWKLKKSIESATTVRRERQRQASAMLHRQNAAEIAELKVNNALLLDGLKDLVALREESFSLEWAARWQKAWAVSKATVGMLDPEWEKRTEDERLAKESDTI